MRHSLINKESNIVENIIEVDIINNYSVPEEYFIIYTEDKENLIWNFKEENEIIEFFQEIVIDEVKIGELWDGNKFIETSNPFLVNEAKFIEN